MTNNTAQKGEKGNIEPEGRNNDEDSVVSHSFTKGNSIEQKAASLGFKIGDHIQAKEPGHWFDYGYAEEFEERDCRVWVRFNGGMCGGFLGEDIIHHKQSNQP